MKHYISLLLLVLTLSTGLVVADDDVILFYQQELLSPASEPLFESDYTFEKIQSDYIFATTNVLENTIVTIYPKDSTSPVSVIGKALFNPNPFKLSDGAKLGFELSRSDDVEIRIYNLRLQEVYRKNHSFASSNTYKKIDFNASSFEFDLSAGVYIFLIVKEGKVLYKGKFAVLP